MGTWRRSHSKLHVAYLKERDCVRHLENVAFLIMQQFGLLAAMSYVYGDNIPEVLNKMLLSRNGLS